LPTKPVVCVIDDDEAARNAVTRHMKSLGFTAIAFPSAVAFLDWSDPPEISCLIADVQMPHITGLELHNRLIASGRTIPTILITAYPDEGLCERALANGVIGYLAKPFDEDTLLACVRSAVARAQRREDRS